MKNCRMIKMLRWLMGVVFIMSSCNGILFYLPMPPMPVAGLVFLGQLLDTGYFIVLLKLIEFSCGLALLFNLYVPLALLVLTPVIVNVVLLHLFLAPSGLPLSLFLLLIHLVLLWSYRRCYWGLLQLR